MSHTSPLPILRQLPHDLVAEIIQFAGLYRCQYTQQWARRLPRTNPAMFAKHFEIIAAATIRECYCCNSSNIREVRIHHGQSILTRQIPIANDSSAWRTERPYHDGWYGLKLAWPITDRTRYDFSVPWYSGTPEPIYYEVGRSIDGLTWEVYLVAD